jgi:hypothetical protein
VWVVPPSIPGSTAGLHRFVWDLRYAASAGRLAADPAALGPWAPPGRYTLVVAADRRTERRTLELRPDPRTRLAPADYARQFSAAARVEDLRGRVATASREASVLHAELLGAAEGQGATFAADLRRAADDLVRTTDLRPGADARATARPGPIALDGLRGLALEGERLARAVDGADGAPTEDASTAVTQFAGTTERTLAAWAALCANELAPLSARLAAAGGAPLSLPPSR